MPNSVARNILISTAVRSFIIKLLISGKALKRKWKEEKLIKQLEKQKEKEKEEEEKKIKLEQEKQLQERLGKIWCFLPFNEYFSSFGSVCQQGFILIILIIIIGDNKYHLWVFFFS